MMESSNVKSSFVKLYLYSLILGMYLLKKKHLKTVAMSYSTEFKCHFLHTRLANKPLLLLYQIQMRSLLSVPGVLIKNDKFIRIELLIRTWV
jgi:hypothetical protein